MEVKKFKKERTIMLIPKAPSWPIIIGSGLTGGLVNWLLDVTFIGIFVFMFVRVAYGGDEPKNCINFFILLRHGVFNTSCLF